MKVQRWQLVLGAALVALTLGWYALRWYAFPGTAMHNEMWRFLIGDMAFLFLQVLLVTFFLDSVMQKREHDEMRQKLNMIVGAFFSQLGTALLGEIARGDEGLGDVRGDLVPSTQWKPSNYAAARAAFSAHDPHIDLGACDLVALRDLLHREKPYLLGLLGNQALLEHETFTDLLWAITHLAEELEVRPGFDTLPAPDRAHLAGDVKRAYTLLGVHWIDYLAHLQSAYPYLFSLAVRTNPLDPSARAEVNA
ncbi:MAG: hypothetical protein FDZ75_01135 [Actinobacteria bacterium]|nr:MAG: hypothetical protein FDZ75_01135 [Actinomycetota bacterium]